MADLAQSAVTINRSWSEGGTTGKELSCRQVTLVLTGQGGTTNRILASVLALSVIEQASNFTDSANAKLFVAAPNVAAAGNVGQGGALLLVDLTQATDASRIPADQTATITGVVKGYL